MQKAGLLDQGNPAISISEIRGFPSLADDRFGFISISQQRSNNRAQNLSVKI